MKLFLIIAFLSVSKIVSAELFVVPRSLEGTEYSPKGFSDKQTAIQKYLAWLTILQTSENNEFSWRGWEINYENDQKDLPAVRYPLAFIGYSIAASVFKTPAYRELSIRILDNVIQRFIQQHQYSYIEFYWKNEPTFPDPVVHENIMYSGHLAQLISLYESISGDFKYTEIGWDFKWSNESVIHYNAAKLMETLSNQTLFEETGGIACEPNSIFIICNNHPRVASQLYDAIHNTSYADANLKWEKWLKMHGKAPESLPIYDYRYFRIIYYKPLHAWIPFYGTSGNDAWALAFMNSWISDKEFARNGFEKLYKSTQWRKPSDDEEFLDAGVFGKISELNTWLASSLYPIVEKQYLGNDAEDDDAISMKSMNVINWFEKNFGEIAYIDKDNWFYFYNITDANYRIWTTANLFLSMMVDENMLSDLYSKPIFNDEPQLTGIDYPRLHVQSAEFDKMNNAVFFGLRTDFAEDVNGTSFRIENAKSFKNAYVTVATNYYNLKKFAKFDPINKYIQFNNINVTHNQFNAFFIQL